MNHEAQLNGLSAGRPDESNVAVYSRNSYRTPTAADLCMEVLAVNPAKKRHVRKVGIDAAVYPGDVDVRVHCVYKPQLDPTVDPADMNPSLSQLRDRDGQPAVDAAQGRVTHRLGDVNFSVYTADRDRAVDLADVRTAVDSANAQIDLSRHLECDHLSNLMPPLRPVLLLSPNNETGFGVLDDDLSIVQVLTSTRRADNVDLCRITRRAFNVYCSVDPPDLNLGSVRETIGLVYFISSRQIGGFTNALTMLDRTGCTRHRACGEQREGNQHRCQSRLHRIILLVTSRFFISSKTSHICA